MKKYNKIWLMFSFVLMLGGCNATLVAPYDPEIRHLLVRSSVEVESFWQNMLLEPADQRQFSQYQRDYQRIAIDLQVLLKLNQMRPKNQESTTQSENLVTLWQQDMQSHKEKDTFKNFLLKRRLKEYQRVFTAMLKAEDAKDI